MTQEEEKMLETIEILKVLSKKVDERTKNKTNNLENIIKELHKYAV